MITIGFIQEHVTICLRFSRFIFFLFLKWIYYFTIKKASNDLSRVISFLPIYLSLLWKFKSVLVLHIAVNHDEKEATSKDGD